MIRSSPLVTRLLAVVDLCDDTAGSRQVKVAERRNSRSKSRSKSRSHHRRIRKYIIPKSEPPPVDHHYAYIDPYATIITEELPSREWQSSALYSGTNNFSGNSQRGPLSQGSRGARNSILGAAGHLIDVFRPNRRHILLVESAEGERLLLQKWLTKMKYNVVTADNGKDAIEKLKQSCCCAARWRNRLHDCPEGNLHIDLIICAFHIPGVQGGFVLDWANIQKGIKRIPFMLLTTDRLEPDEMWRLHRRGCKDIITKPCNRAYFLKTVRFFLEEFQSMNVLESFRVEGDSIKKRIIDTMEKNGNVEDIHSPRMQEDDYSGQFVPEDVLLLVVTSGNEEVERWLEESKYSIIFIGPEEAPLLIDPSSDHHEAFDILLCETSDTKGMELLSKVCQARLLQPIIAFGNAVPSNDKMRRCMAYMCVPLNQASFIKRIEFILERLRRQELIELAVRRTRYYGDILNRKDPDRPKPPSLLLPTRSDSTTVLASPTFTDYPTKRGSILDFFDGKRGSLLGSVLRGSMIPPIDGTPTDRGVHSYEHQKVQVRTGSLIRATTTTESDSAPKKGSPDNRSKRGSLMVVDTSKNGTLGRYNSNIETGGMGGKRGSLVRYHSSERARINPLDIVRKAEQLNPHFNTSEKTVVCQKIEVKQSGSSMSS